MTGPLQSQPQKQTQAQSQEAAPTAAAATKLSKVSATNAPVTSPGVTAAAEDLVEKAPLSRPGPLVDRAKSASQCKWEQMFERLLVFKREHGDCLVPNRYPQEPALGSWVSTQRRQYKILTSNSTESTPMTAERARKLESVGFVWQTRDPRHVPWETRYKELCEYQKKHGDCLIPIGYKDNVQLSNWVSTQRQEYKLMRDGRPSRLTDDRIRLLEKVGFVWEAQRGGPRKRKRPLSANPLQQAMNKTSSFLFPRPDMSLSLHQASGAATNGLVVNTDQDSVNASAAGPQIKSGTVARVIGEDSSHSRCFEAAGELTVPASSAGKLPWAPTPLSFSSDSVNAAARVVTDEATRPWESYGNTSENHSSQHKRIKVGSESCYDELQQSQAAKFSSGTQPKVVPFLAPPSHQSANSAQLQEQTSVAAGDDDIFADADEDDLIHPAVIDVYSGFVQANQGESTNTQQRYQQDTTTPHAAAYSSVCSSASTHCNSEAEMLCNSHVADAALALLSWGKRENNPVMN